MSQMATCVFGVLSTAVMFGFHSDFPDWMKQCFALCPIIAVPEEE